MKPARREAYFSCLKFTVEHSANSIELLCKSVFLLSGRYNNFAERLPYSNNNAAISMSANVDQSGNAHIKILDGSKQTLLKFWTDRRVTVEKYDGSKWSSSGDLLGNTDYEIKSITNQYALNIHLIRFGNDNIKVIRLSGYINKALTAGTEYLIATNAVLKSRTNWYHNVFVSGKGSDLMVYISIDADGNIKITPRTAIASGTAINMMEYYV